MLYVLCHRGPVCYLSLHCVLPCQHISTSVSSLSYLFLFVLISPQVRDLVLEGLVDPVAK